MTGGHTHRGLGFAWLYLCCHLAAHGIEEAAGGFIDVWNPVLATIRAATGIPLPHFEFSAWLTYLSVGVLILFAMTPLVFARPRGMAIPSMVFGFLMILNGVNHLISPLYLGRFLPGQFTSPLLILSGGWLILQATRVRGTAADLRPIAGSTLFFLVAPGTVVGWIPYAISGWHMHPPFLGIGALRTVGAILLLLGVCGLVESFARFALRGLGTPAPIAPPEHLVVSGLYRYARNPMYICVISAIIGQALLFGDVALLEYAGIVWLSVHAFVVAYEEPTLTAQFGRSYERYRADVPRWLPRLRPWAPPA